MNHVRNRHNARDDIKFLGCNPLSVPYFPWYSWSSANRFALCGVDVYLSVYVCMLACVFVHVEVAGRYCLSSVALHLKRLRFSLNSKLADAPSLAGQ